MLNLRYHVVSLVAVFLALGIGVIMGATVIDRVTVDQLRNRLDGVEASDRKTRSENDRLSAQIGTWNKFADQGRTELLSNQLQNVPVLLVGVNGIDRKSVSDLRSQLATAGANVEGTLWLNDKLNLKSQADATALAASIAIPDATPDIARAGALSKLAEALDRGSDPTGIIAALHQGGFLDYEAPPAPASTSSSTPTFGLDTIPVRGTRSVIISGAGARLDDETMTMPFVTQLALNDAPVIAAEAGRDTPGGRDVFVGLILRHPETAPRISTVDNLESLIGQAAVVLALRDIGKQPPNHYGVGAGAQRLLPETPSTP